jgi:hypothetical protein
MKLPAVPLLRDGAYWRRRMNAGEPNRTIWSFDRWIKLMVRSKRDQHAKWGPMAKPGPVNRSPCLPTDRCHGKQAWSPSQVHEGDHCWVRKSPTLRVRDGMEPLSSFSSGFHLRFTADNVTIIDASAGVINPDCQATDAALVDIALFDSLLRYLLHSLLRRFLLRYLLHCHAFLLSVLRSHLSTVRVPAEAFDAPLLVEKVPPTFRTGSSEENRERFPLADFCLNRRKNA